MEIYAQIIPSGQIYLFETEHGVTVINSFAELDVDFEVV